MSALQGTVVIELGQIYNGPYAGYLLAAGGATVYKIEPPRGDYLRARDGEVGLHFALLNAGKRSAVLDLKHPEGCELLRKMVRLADVVIENYAPGTMERFGLAPESLVEENQRLVYATSSGYGRSGKRRNMPAMDMAVQAASGVMSATGFPDRPPVRSAASIADFLSGVHLYGAIVTALLQRERTGNGQIVEVAMLDAMLPAQATLFAAYFATGEAPRPNGNRHAAIAPYDVYPARDGWVAILCGVDEASGRQQ
jgi:CoA:oxalate CoA-transferase